MAVQLLGLVVEHTLLLPHSYGPSHQHSIPAIQPSTVLLLAHWNLQYNLLTPPNEDKHLHCEQHHLIPMKEAGLKAKLFFHILTNFIHRVVTAQESPNYLSCSWLEWMTPHWSFQGHTRDVFFNRDRTFKTGAVSGKKGTVKYGPADWSRNIYLYQEEVTLKHM